MRAYAYKFSLRYMDVYRELSLVSLLARKKKNQNKRFCYEHHENEGGLTLPQFFGFTVIPHQLRNIFVTILSVYFKKGRRGQTTNYFLAPLLKSYSVKPLRENKRR